MTRDILTNTEMRVKFEKFENAIYKLTDIFSSQKGLEMEITGSFAMFLYGICPLESVKDLDIILHVSSEQSWESLKKILSVLAPSSNGHSASYMNTSLSGCLQKIKEMFNKTTNTTHEVIVGERLSINIDGVDICIFKSAEDNSLTIQSAETINIPQLTYKNIPVAPVCHILSAKAFMGRAKDMQHISRYASNILSYCDMEDKSKTAEKNTFGKGANGKSTSSNMSSNDADFEPRRKPSYCNAY